MINSAAARDPAGDADAVRLGIGDVDLRVRVLVPPQDDRGGVLPEHEHGLLGMKKQKFLNGKIQIRIGGW